MAVLIVGSPEHFVVNPHAIERAEDGQAAITCEIDGGDASWRFDGMELCDHCLPGIMRNRIMRADRGRA